MKFSPLFKYANTPGDRGWFLMVTDSKSGNKYRVQQFFAITKTTGEAHPGVSIWKFILGPFVLGFGVTTN